MDVERGGKRSAPPLFRGWTKASVVYEGLVSLKKSAVAASLCRRTPWWKRAIPAI